MKMSMKEVTPLIERNPHDVPKLRNCLRCRAEFQSEWSGERVCRRCKGTSSWRNGLPKSMN